MNMTSGFQDENRDGLIISLEDFIERDKEVPSIDKIILVKSAFIIVLILMIPNAVLIYRARILTLEQFLEIKKNQGDKKGPNYKWWYRRMNGLFCCSRTRELGYMEYLMFKRREK